MCFAPQRRALFPTLFRHLNLQKWSENGVFCTFWLGNVLRATTACTFSTSQLPKVVRQWCALYILTWKCASRHNGVHFFDIWTSKSGPKLRCFVHFDLEMCFAPQRRALFRHLNFQKWSEPGVFCTFWLGNVLRATTACNFSSLVWPAGSAPAALASLLFDPPEHKSLEKHSVSRLSYLFAHLPLLSSDLVSSDSSHLCFSTVHIVGSFTSKLPSILYCNILIPPFIFKFHALWPGSHPSNAFEFQQLPEASPSSKGWLNTRSSCTLRTQSLLLQFQRFWLTLYFAGYIPVSWFSSQSGWTKTADFHQIRPLPRSMLRFMEAVSVAYHTTGGQGTSLGV